MTEAPPVQGRPSSDETVFARLLDHLVDVSPVAATQLGDHRRDGDLDEWAPGETDRRLQTIASLRADLDAIGDAGDGEVAGDIVLVSDALDSLRFELELQRSPERDPLFYLGLATAGVHDLIRRDDLPHGPRAAAAVSRVAQVPRLLEQAQANLTEVPEPNRRLALLRLRGAAGLFGEVLPGFAPQAGDAAPAAVESCRRFGAWLEDLDGPFPPWRLGGTWNDALRLALGVRMTADELWERATAALQAGQEEMERLAARVLGREAAGLEGPDLVRAGVAVASRNCSDRSTVVADAAAVLAEIKEFIRVRGDFALPEPDTLRVEEVPPFAQGAAVAYFVPAPPLEPEAAHTYYLSPVPQDWDAARAASFLREYNIHALCSVGIHEAYPGHYVHLAFAQRHPRLVRRVLWNSAFVEGWAVYVERRLIDAGFGGSGEHGDGMRLISAKMEMRSIANALLDQGMHVRDWTDEQAMTLMIDQTYQEAAEAQAKLLRSQTSAGQLSTYFVGGAQMDDLRRDAEAQRGAAFAAPAFHADVLAQGAPPFPVLRRALLTEAAA